MSRFRFRVRHSTVVAYLALAISLGGVSYGAAVVTSLDIQNNTIRSIDVHDHTLQKKDLSAKAIAALGGKQTKPIVVASNPNTSTDPCSANPIQTLVYCGTSTSHWVSGGFGVDGIEVWKDSLGNVHIQGSATVTGSITTAYSIFRLPAGMQPSRILGFVAATSPNAGGGGGGQVLILIYPPSSGSAGYLTLYQPENASDVSVHLGEIVFRADT